MQDKLCCLSIAGLTVAVQVNDTDLAGRLCNRYRDFPPIGQPHCLARVQWTPQSRRQPDPAPTVVPDGNRLRFVTPGFSGWIDLDHATAELSLMSTSPVEDIDYFLRVAYAWLIFRNRGLLLHAAAIVRRGQAHVFLGRSGSGKTTVARVSVGDVVLNDDLVVILPDGGNWQVHATPFWNPDQVRPTAGQAPLAAFYRLVQDRHVFIEPMRTAQALAELMANAPLVSSASHCNAELIERCLAVLQSAPAYRLHFLPDNSFWNVIEE